jgi:hypothetical protein
MTRASRVLFVVLVALIAFACGFVACKAGGPRDDGDDTMDDESVRRLVDQLASKNHSPGLVWKSTRLPPDYDLNEQKRVHGVYVRLGRLGLRAVPFLLEHLDDDRYSTTRDYSTFVDRSVGWECEGIILDIVQCRACSPTSKGVPYWDHRYFGQVASGRLDLRDWWSRNSHRTLRELRIAAAEYAALQEGSDRDGLEAELKVLRAGKPISLEAQFASYTVPVWDLSKAF